MFTNSLSRVGRTSSLHVMVTLGFLAFGALHYGDQYHKRCVSIGPTVVCIFQFTCVLACSRLLDRKDGRIAVITVEPAGKASFVLGCIQTRLIWVNTMENDP